MPLRNFRLDSSKAYQPGYAVKPLRADTGGDAFFSHALIPILDADLSDEDGSEPDGVNDFVRHLGSEEMDQH